MSTAAAEAAPAAAATATEAARAPAAGEGDGRRRREATDALQWQRRRRQQQHLPFRARNVAMCVAYTYVKHMGSFPRAGERARGRGRERVGYVQCSAYH